MSHSSQPPISSRGETGHRVYVACPSRRIERARCVAAVLVKQTELVTIDGAIVRRPLFDVCSRWHGGSVPVSDDLPLDVMAVLADQNLDDLASADAVVALTEEEKGLAVGRETYAEIGMAVMLGKPIVWSTEKGGVALSIARPNVEPVSHDDRIADVLRAVVRRGARRAMRQTGLAGMGIAAVG